MTAPPVISTTEALMLPQLEAVADESSKAELNDFLALAYRKIMTEADEEITSYPGAAGRASR